MAEAHDFLKNLAMVLCVAAVTTIVFQRLRQPVVLSYLFAGVIIGPHVPIPLVADQNMVRTLSELGVILVMFSLGLEFRLRKLVAVGPRVALIAIIEVSIMVWLGFVTARLLGWSPRASLFAGAVVAISSTTIIAKAFDEAKVTGRLRDAVFGILIAEDLVAVLLLTLLTALGSGRGLSAGALSATTARLITFLVGLLAVGMLLVPRAMRAIVRLGRSEIIVVTSIGLCFAISLLAQFFGYSVALGAFLAGALVAESGDERVIAPLVQPVRDMFAAIFFVAAGMSIDPALIARHWGVVAAFAAVVLVGKTLSVTLGTFLAGYGTRVSLQTGMSLAQVGEFSFIIAALGTSQGVVPDVFYPATVAVSALTTALTPWFIRGADPFARLVDRKLPHRIQTFVSLYASWVEQLGQSSRRRTAGARLRRLIVLLLLDAVLLGVLVVGTALSLPLVAGAIEARLGVGRSVARALVIGAALLLTTPFGVGIIQLARRLGSKLADMALPVPAAGTADLAAAPRRVLVVTLQLAIVLIVGLPLVAITQPFLPSFQGAVLLLVLLAIVGVAFWRSTTNLQGHVRAGAQMIVEALATQSRTRVTAEHSLDLVQKLLPGLGTPIPFRLPPASPAVGQSLAQLNLRGATGATVLAITRGERGLVVPTADEVLQAEDVLALAGSHEAIAAATSLLGASHPVLAPKAADVHKDKGI